MRPLNSKLSRRHFLQGAGALALGAGLVKFNVLPALAQGSALMNVTAFARVRVGTFDVTVMQDASFPFDPAIFGTNATAEDIAAVLAASNVRSARVNASVNIMLVNTGSSLVLLDTGNGASSGGRLLATLEVLGIAPGDINAVVISHFHPDHVGGAAASGAMTFPDATYYFPEAEWAFMDSASAASPAQSAIMGANTALKPALDAGKLTLYAAEGTIVPGIEAVPAAGHTPGHTAFMVSSGSSQMLNIVDTALNNIVSLARPDWYAGFDAAPEEAAATRLALLTRAAEEGLQVFGYHFPFPGIGYVVAQGEGFSFVPAF
jgi:glyoxylase-like metal-dependent hydrolase (beta-lactamase superfamily II)